PQRGGDALIEHPADRQMDDVLAEALLRELIEPCHGGEILRKPRPLKFWIGTTKIITLEFAVRPHAPGQEPAAVRAVREGRDLVLSAIGEGLGVNGALEQIVGRLQHVQRRNAAEALHLPDREITYADGADLTLLEEDAHGLRGFL